jgi:hypothetical protein
VYLSVRKVSEKSKKNSNTCDCGFFTLALSLYWNNALKKSALQ